MNGDIIVSAQAGRDWLGTAIAIITCVSTFVGAIILWLYTIYTKRYTKHTEKLVELTNTALEESSASSAAALAETRRSNEATEESNRIARESIELGRRAWVIATGIDAPKEFFPGKLRVKVTMRNSGGVPATNVVVKMSAAVLSPSMFLQETPIVYGDEQRYAVIPVRRPVPGLIVYNLTEEDVRRVETGEATLYVIYHIDYTDTFKKPRWSVSCWQYSHEVKSWAVAPKHNHAE